MTTITFKGSQINTIATLPKMNTIVPDFTLVRKDLSEVTLNAFKGKKKLLNIFPSLETGVCAMSVKQFYKKIGTRNDVVVLNISKDLPFAQGRFCIQEAINAEVLSAFRSSFARDYGIEITDGPLKGLCSRAVVLLDENNKVLYTEQVPEITQEPDYDKVLAML